MSTKPLSTAKLSPLLCRSFSSFLHCIRNHVSWSKRQQASIACWIWKCAEVVSFYPPPWNYSSTLLLTKLLLRIRYPKSSNLPTLQRLQPTRDMQPDLVMASGTRNPQPRPSSWFLSSHSPLGFLAHCHVHAEPIPCAGVMVSLQPRLPTIYYAFYPRPLAHSCHTSSSPLSSCC